MNMVLALISQHIYNLQLFSQSVSWQDAFLAAQMAFVLAAVGLSILLSGLRLLETLR